MDELRQRPFWDQIGSLTALILLAYGLNQIIVLPSVSTEVPVLGILIQLEINTRFIMLTFAAFLAAAGVGWLIQSHPNFQLGRSPLEHMIIPALATLSVGVILTRLPLGPNLVIAFCIAAFLLIIVFRAEYISHDAADPRYPVAAFGLRLLAILLLIGIIFAARSLDIRALYSVPIVLATTAGTSWRWLRLTTHGRDSWVYALTIGWIAAQTTWSLHYWPINPVKVGLLIGVEVYVLASLTTLHLQEKIQLRDLTEYGLILAITILLISITT